MDKLKSVMAFMKKFGFWFLTGLIVLVVLSTWWLATNAQAKEKQARIAKVKEGFTGVQKILDTPQHPNEKYIEAVGKEHDALKEKVLAAWQSLYQEQKQNNPWPEVLGKDFIDMINSLKPGEEIPLTDREIYLNCIKRYFPELFKIIKLRQPQEVPEAAAKGGAAPARLGMDRMGGAMPGTDPNSQVEMVGVVDWDETDRKRLESNFDWNETPSDLKVRTFQEDLWVILSLLRVIKNTNGDVTEHSKAAIKRIDALEIGAYAVTSWKQAEQLVFSGAAGLLPVAVDDGRSRGVPPTAMPGAAGVATSEKDTLMRDRYVDDKGEPLTADATPPYAEFKMMPICMKLVIDQRKIATLLAECANSAMPIEVRRVRLNPGKGQVVNLSTMGTEGGGGGGMSAPPMRGPEMRVPMGEMGAMRGRMPPGMEGTRGAVRTPTTMAGGTTSSEQSPMDISVEIQGVIYIYNPPDRSKLGTGAANEKPPTAPATPAAPANAVPATPAAPATTPAAPANATPDNAAPANAVPAAPVVPPTNTNTGPANPTDPAVPPTPPAKVE